jgi:MFS family permease
MAEGVSLSRSVSVFRTVFANRGLRRVELAFVGFSMAEWATWVAIMVFAFQQGGATEAGAVAVAQLVPATIAAPLASVLGDRYRRDRILLLGYAAQSGAMAATAASLLTGAPIPVTYAFAALTATAITLTRPTQGALLPSLASTPQELTAANVASGTVESLSFLVGPAAAGFILGLSGPGAVFVTMAVMMALSAAIVSGLDAASPAPVDHEAGIHGVLIEAREGFRALGSESRVRLVIGMIAAQSIVLGALDVLVVALAIGVLKLSEAWPAYFDAALGAGGVIGSAIALALVGRRRLSIPLALGVIVLGLPIAAIGLAPAVVLGLGMFIVAGAGRVVLEISGRTLLQRIVRDEMLSRVFGILEGLYMGAMAAGSALAALLVALLGIRGGLIAAGAILPVTALAVWARLTRIDADALIPARELELLRGEPMFAPLSPPVIERMAAAMISVEVPPGADVIRQGEPGDRFYILDEGEAKIFIDGTFVHRAGPGDSFGEIALLRDVPRTATVTAVTACRLLALERDVFIEAVTGHPVSSAAALAVVDERLGARGADQRTAANTDA